MRKCTWLGFVAVKEGNTMTQIVTNIPEIIPPLYSRNIYRNDVVDACHV
jgi:hypothetical protein